jgi:hypothetical protein
LGALNRRTAGNNTVVTMATPPTQKTTAITWIARAMMTSSINLLLPSHLGRFRDTSSDNGSAEQSA